MSPAVPLKQWNHATRVTRVALGPSIRATAHAAPNPLSMPTTVTPDAHDDSIARSAVTPANDDPYPVLVGTATTGAPLSPPTTLASAPSMPATTTIASASTTSS